MLGYIYVVNDSIIYYRIHEPYIDKATMEQVGDIRFTARENLGENYLKCNGDIVTDSKYSELMSILKNISPDNVLYKSNGNYSTSSIFSTDIWQPEPILYGNGYIVMCGSMNGGAAIKYCKDGDTTYETKALGNPINAEYGKSCGMFDGNNFIFFTSDNGYIKVWRCSNPTETIQNIYNIAVKDYIAPRVVKYLNNRYVVIGGNDGELYAYSSTSLTGSWSSSKINTSNIRYMYKSFTNVYYNSPYYVITTEHDEFGQYSYFELDYTTSLTGVWSKGISGVLGEKRNWSSFYIDGKYCFVDMDGSSVAIRYTESPTNTSYKTYKLNSVAKSSTFGFTIFDKYVCFVYNGSICYFEGADISKTIFTDIKLYGESLNLFYCIMSNSNNKFFVCCATGDANGELYSCPVDYKVLPVVTNKTASVFIKAK